VLDFEHDGDVAVVADCHAFAEIVCLSHKKKKVLWCFAVPGGEMGQRIFTKRLGWQLCSSRARMGRIDL
jgi:hypothetical protein